MLWNIRTHIVKALIFPRNTFSSMVTSFRFGFSRLLFSNHMCFWMRRNLGQCFLVVLMNLNTNLVLESDEFEKFDLKFYYISNLYLHLVKLLGIQMYLVSLYLTPFYCWAPFNIFRFLLSSMSLFFTIKAHARLHHFHEYI